MAKFEAGMEAMLDTFLFETNDLLEKLDEILIRTEQEQEIAEEDINEIFRTMHTIKGSAAMMGLDNMSKLAHSVEDLFYIIREDKNVSYDKGELYELLFAGSDNLKNELENLSDESIPLTDFSPLIEKIHQMSNRMKGEQGGEADKKGEEKESSLPEGLFSQQDGKDVAVFKINYQESCAMPSARAMVLIRNLKRVCKIILTIPEDLDDDNADDKISSEGFFVKVSANNPDVVLEIINNSINVQNAQIITKPEKKSTQTENKDVQEKKNSGNDKRAEPKKAAEKKEQNFLSVRLDKLDRLLDLVSEIVIAQSSVTASPDLRDAGINLDRFRKSSRELKKLTDELQDVVMSIRMVPVSTAFQKMNRVIRDMNAKLKKNVTLVFEGQETEVDKSIIDILGDPLMHIVRNAVDHGIETPQQRADAGKTEKPTVTLSAFYDSNEVVISCKDNGAGMDAAKLMAKAKKNGLLTKPESEYTQKEIFNFVTAAGFSTNEEITEYSGRGVGMDVVKKNIEKVGGKLIVDSVFGEGSTFTIRIPLSLSITDVLSVLVGKISLSIPSASVAEAFCCKKEDCVSDEQGNEFVYSRGECLPVIRLGEHLDISGVEEELSKGIMIHCRENGKDAAIFADSLICDQQVVVKPFSPLLSHMKLKEAGMAGCSILGDGSITLILDMKQIIESGVEDDGN